MNRYVIQGRGKNYLAGDESVGHMPMPIQATVELPLLKAISEAGGELNWREAVGKVTVLFPELTAEDLSSELDSGGNRWMNRVQWARQNLVARGELSSQMKGIWAITERGRQRLETEWPAWIPRYSATVRTGPIEKGVTDQLPGGPREQLENIRRLLLETVIGEVFSKTLELTPPAFEGLVKRLLERIGYSNVKVTGRVGDEGIDGMCSTDKLGLVKVSFQAKRWQSPVGAKEIRDFVGSLRIARVAQGIFVTTSDFTRDAVKTAEKSGNIKLVSGGQLAELMVEAGLGVARTSLDIPTLDEDFFEGTI